VDSVYLREKDLTPSEYMDLLSKMVTICDGKTELYAVKYLDVAKTLGIHNVHLSYRDFLETYSDLHIYNSISVSVHSVEEAIQCERLGATRLVTGHIFPTDCKKGLPPRGLEHLQRVCESVNLPVYAIGGITPTNANDIISSGADGVCIMSSLMATDTPNLLLKKFD
jgi:thiamine-phosphate pyrophosphorylase